MYGEPRNDQLVLMGPRDGEDMITFHVEYWAELSNGRRIETAGRYGGQGFSQPREGLGAITHRHYGSSTGDLDQLDREYRIRESDVIDAIRLSLGKDRWERDEGLASWWGRLSVWRWERQERRTRWSALRALLKDNGLEVSVKQLEGMPFEIEIDDELKAELDYS